MVLVMREQVMSLHLPGARVVIGWVHAVGTCWNRTVWEWATFSLVRSCISLHLMLLLLLLCCVVRNPNIHSLTLTRNALDRDHVTLTVR